MAPTKTVPVPTTKRRWRRHVAISVLAIAAGFLTGELVPGPWDWVIASLVVLVWCWWARRGAGR